MHVCAFPGTTRNAARRHWHSSVEKSATATIATMKPLKTVQILEEVSLLFTARDFPLPLSLPFSVTLAPALSLSLAPSRSLARGALVLSPSRSVSASVARSFRRAPGLALRLHLIRQERCTLFMACELFVRVVNYLHG